MTPTPSPFHNPMLEWWQQQWIQGTHPMARMQLAWMESLAETMEFEAQFLMAIAESGEKMAQCFDVSKPATPEEMQARYHDLIKQVNDAHVKRLERVAQMTDDFRERLWEEI